MGLGDLGGKRGTGAVDSDGFIRLGLGTKISPFESSELLESQLLLRFFGRATLESDESCPAVSLRRLTIVFAVEGGVGFGRVIGFIGLAALDG